MEGERWDVEFLGPKALGVVDPDVKRILLIGGLTVACISAAPPEER